MASWYGSKGTPGLSQAIVAAMPAHDVYIELFLGVRVKGRVADQCRESNVLKKVGYRHQIVARTGEDNKTDQFPNRVRQRDALTRQTAL